jgi:large-conductance mechanosensitive channel
MAELLDVGGGLLALDGGGGVQAPDTLHRRLQTFGTSGLSFTQELRSLFGGTAFLVLVLAIVVALAVSSVILSLVRNLLLPPLQLAADRIDLSRLNVQLRPRRVSAATGIQTAPVVLRFGDVLETLMLSLLVIVLALLALRAINRQRLPDADAAATQAER